MRRLLPIALTCLLVPGVSSAQLSQHSTVGFGVAVNSNFEIRVPLRLAEHWRLEPSLLVFDSKQSLTAKSSGLPDQNYDYKVRTWSFGALLGRMIPLDSMFTLYIGPRFALERNSSTEQVFLGGSTPTDISISSLDKEIGLVTGGELALGRHLSVGGEASIRYTFLGHASVEPSDAPPGLTLGNIPNGGHQLFTSAAIVVRWFL